MRTQNSNAMSIFGLRIFGIYILHTYQIVHPNNEQRSNKLIILPHLGIHYCAALWLSENFRPNMQQSLNDFSCYYFFAFPSNRTHSAQMSREFDGDKIRSFSLSMAHVIE